NASASILAWPPARLWRPSWTSPALSFTSRSPRSGSCRVRCGTICCARSAPRTLRSRLPQLLFDVAKLIGQLSQPGAILRRILVACRRCTGQSQWFERLHRIAADEAADVDLRQHFLQRQVVRVGHALVFQAAGDEDVAGVRPETRVRRRDLADEIGAAL